MYFLPPFSDRNTAKPVSFAELWLQVSWIESGVPTACNEAGAAIDVLPGLPPKFTSSIRVGRLRVVTSELTPDCTASPTSSPSNWLPDDKFNRPSRVSSCKRIARCFIIGNLPFLTNACESG
jgi:hypothetical protein